MLQLKQIKKNYVAGGNVVQALKGIDISFRKAEFVCILGPSGCGKTTLLNIIGGLDRYDEGELLIGGRSTKQFLDRDWDRYRNHSIGFVFQSYNLIPHQTVLQNVELALTLSGVGKEERRRRAIDALRQVGLEEQLHKKPGEMSGGQMQRVAIARALVNNPDIVLADEPTGALDTKTSIQVMEILKQVSKERLVIMVTHNPQLAQQYASRTINILDGEVTGDSDPYTPGAEQEIADKPGKTPSMSFATAFSLSLKNLFTKKGRTLLTSFAGSIGIIGIALILAISQGMTAYIDQVQESALTSYPLMIESTAVDLSSLMENFMGSEQSEDYGDDAVYVHPAMYDTVHALGSMKTAENDLKAFGSYVQEQLQNKDSRLYQALSGVQYTYDFDMPVYTKGEDGSITISDTSQLLQQLLRENMDATSLFGTMMQQQDTSTQMSISPQSSGIWQELLPGKDGQPVNSVLQDQYDLVYGSWPNDYNEVVLILNENNELDDITLYALGLTSKEQATAVVQAALNGEQAEQNSDSYTYQQLCDLTFCAVPGYACYTKDPATGGYTDLRESDAGLKYLYDNGIQLKVSGILRPNKDAENTMLKSGVAYTRDLTLHIMEQAQGADIVKEQLADTTTDIFTGLPFEENTGNLTDAQKAEALKNYIKNTTQQNQADMYVKIKSIPSKEQLDAGVQAAMAGVTREQIEQNLAQVLSQQMGMDAAQVAEYLADMEQQELEEIYKEAVAGQVQASYAAGVQSQLAGADSSSLAALLLKEIDSYTQQECAEYYDQVMEFSTATYRQNLQKLACVQQDDPSGIYLYASSFENKDIVEEEIADYNKGADEAHQITYTDYVGLMMSFVTTIIHTITYVLIAFVAISLIVSSIMIGVVTLISVQERTKEIGILRAMGASKRDVSSMFNAETLIIGFGAGLMGVLVTALLCIPINAVIHALTGIGTLNAYLPPVAAVVLVIISMLLTLVAGIIPSKSAAKKDPVVALRSE